MEAKHVAYIIVKLRGSKICQNQQDTKATDKGQSHKLAWASGQMKKNAEICSEPDYMYNWYI